MRHFSVELLIYFLAGFPVAGCTSNESKGSFHHDSGTSLSDEECGTCDDTFSCTIDTCTVDGCVHLIGPNRGATVCSAGQFCTLEHGCISAPACANDAQCAEYWAADACKSNTRCDPASSLCVFDILDKDRDGYAPPVCGGGDCNDANGSVHPEAAESCNGMDDNCSGAIDEPGPGIDQECGTISVCENGSCACKPENSCGAFCTDIQRNVEHCGGCDQSCGTSPGASAGWGTWSCAEGQCACSGDACAAVCTNLQKDDDNCGECSHACGADERCQGGTCTSVHVCTRYEGVCESDEFCRTSHPAHNLGGVGVGCTTSMCDCPDYTYTCGRVNDWEYECFPG